MALIHCNFFSEILGMSTAMDVILPQAPAGQIGMEGHVCDTLAPCLYLLHGLSDDETIWQRRTSIERYVSSLGWAVVMPNVHRSFYTDMCHGYRYWSYISEEIPRLAESFFHISSRREDRYVAGLSMGGYGAFKLALLRPDLFCAAASLSGALDVADRVESPSEDDEVARLDIPLVFGEGESIRGSQHDLLAAAGQAVDDAAPLPRLYQWCGTEDFLYEDNIRFRDHARTLGIDLTYEEGPGSHEWGAWDTQIQRVLMWMTAGSCVAP